MKSIDVMDDLKLHTGNTFADIKFTQHLAQVPEFWALVEYLEKKGILDRAEFFDVLNQKCTQQVIAANILEREKLED